MAKMTLELVPASKRLRDSDISQGNTRLLRSWIVPGKYSPRSTQTCSVWAYLSCGQLNEPTIRFRLENVLVMRLGQGPMPNRPEALCRTVSFYQLIPLIITSLSGTGIGNSTFLISTNNTKHFIWKCYQNLLLTQFASFAKSNVL